MDSYKNDIFEAFKNKCYDFISSKYILSQIRIKAILEWIVINPSLYDFIKKCSIGIDFRNEFNKIVSYNNGNLDLPNSKRYIITIVVGILYDLDNGNISLSNLLINYFKSENMEESFNKFNETFIIPFINAVSELYLSDKDPMIDDSIDEEKKIEMKNVDFTTLFKILSPKLKELNTIVQGDNSIDEDKRAEYTIMTEGFLHAISISDPIIIKVCFIGLKNTFKDNKKYRIRLQELENYLKKYSYV